MAKTESHRLGESALIERFFAPLSHPDASFGLSDDVAFLDIPSNQHLVLTKDMLVADVHFIASDPPDLIAQKALRVNLSDLASKAAEPLGYLLGLGLPAHWDEEWLAQFCEGLARDQKAFSFQLLGGDTVKCAERLTLSITAFGMAPKGVQLLRKKAAVGENIYVTGTIGDGALGLRAHRRQGPKGFEGEAERAYLADRYLLPQPRLTMQPILRRYARAAMDISDGLLGDANKMANASHKAFVLEQQKVPLSDAALNWINAEPDLLTTALSGGDDYELLFTAAPNHHQAILSEAQKIGVQVTCIGSVQAGHGVSLIGPNGAETQLGSQSYEHF